MVEEPERLAVVHEVSCGGRGMAWRQWGSGPVLVLVHGNSGSWTHWVRNVLPLAQHFTVLVPDLPGHGDSELPEGEVSCANFADLLWQGVDRLTQQEGRVALAGFSLGSLLVESMAMQRPASVRQVVLLRGSFMRSSPKPPETLMRWRGIDDPAERARIHRHNLAVSMFGNPDLIDDTAVAVQARNVERCRLDVRPLLASRQMEAFTTLRCDVHGIAGELDVYGGGDVAAQGRALLEILPQASFDLVPGAGHWAAYEASSQVNAMMVNALMRNTGG
ncbi:MAG: alpha/beta hydrolase [Pigmentiphaga sp.]|uniref:alpha/beta fold hydrolase n=1 Tax=Pigmentiphaga sp. TaxID=1977564 RepID=UPI0029A4BCB5|nr:alpha/beta hydrolase [Pigmentiphaga sp.]MDX3905223.1 alpha/beta hydrolase [Pigmentiphaga sp.]